MADEKKGKEETDPRLDFISSYVTKTYRIKSDKWQKLMTSDEKVAMTVPVGYAITFFYPFMSDCDC